MTHAVAILSVTALSLAACGDDDAADGDASAAVSVEGGDLYFEPESLTAAAGTVEITLENVGTQDHDVVIEELDDLEVVYTGPGETDTGTVDLDAGTYTFYCSIPGHREAGMEGTLNVS